MRLELLAPLLLIVSPQPGPPSAGPAFTMVSAVLYQPDDVLSRRVPSMEELSRYIQQLESTSATVFGETRTPEGLDIVVAVRPSGASRVWFVSTAPNPESRFARLRGRLEAVAAPKVHEGPVLFAIIGSVAGMRREAPRADDGFQPPHPEEWKTLLTRRDSKDALGTDALMDLVWPERR